MSEPENGGAPREEGADAGEAEAWAEVARAWEDEERHRAYLDRFRDLEGLALAGSRYREALASRPGDPVALRSRDEILRRATALGLAAVPRTNSQRGRARRAARFVAIALTILLAALAALAARGLFAAIGASP